MELDQKFQLDNATLNSLEKGSSKLSLLYADIESAIQSSKLTIIDLIQQLGCLLTNQSFSKREIGVLILAEVMGNLDEKCLNTEELSVISTYLVEKLKDHHQIVPAAIKGLLTCMNFKHLPSTLVLPILSTIYQHVSCQQQQQPDRYNIFQIYEISLKKFPSEVNSLAYDFVYGVITSVDGERDPKNLRYIFSWMPLCLATVKLGHLSEEMFEVLACYFPVDFKAPSSNPSSITRKELADGLCACLTAIAEFGEYALALALEKLESDLKIAKEDSLDILKKGCQVYETNSYSTHSIEIWSQLQMEIFNTNDISLRTQCLETFTAVVAKLSQNDANQFSSFVDNITDTLKGNLVPNQKLFFSSSWILIAVAKASSQSSILVASKIIPLLENTFRITSNSKHKALILSVCIEVVVSLISYQMYDSKNFNVPLICFQAVLDQDSELRREGYKGLSEIISILSQQERFVLYKNLNKSILIDSDSAVKPSIFKCIENLALLYPEELKLHVFEKEKPNSITELNNCLEALSVLSKIQTFKEYAVDQLINHVDKNTAVAVKNINRIVGNSKDIDELFLSRNFIERLINAALNNNQSFQADFIENLCLVLNKLIRSQTSEKQQEIFSSQSKLGIQDSLVSMTILKGLIISMKPEALAPFQDVIVTQVLRLTLQFQDNFVNDISVKILANILNKMENGSLLEEKLNRIKEAYNTNKPIRHDIVSWVTKALVIKNHPKSFQWVDQILDHLESDKKFCDGLKIILNEEYEELSRINHCQVMPLYRQKFFVYCTNKIVEKYDPQKSNYLIAIGCLIEFAPAQAVAAQFKKILKLIIHCLEKCEEPTVLTNLLFRIEEFVEKKEKSIEDNLEDILLRVLNLTVFQACMKVRIAALHCLAKFAQNYEVYKLLPLKNKVTQHLSVCVDDKKRLVRKEAMDARSIWYLLDAPI